MNIYDEGELVKEVEEVQGEERIREEYQLDRGTLDRLHKVLVNVRKRPYRKSHLDDYFSYHSDDSPPCSKSRKTFYSANPSSSTSSSSSPSSANR